MHGGGASCWMLLTGFLDCEARVGADERTEQLFGAERARAARQGVQQAGEVRTSAHTLGWRRRFRSVCLWCSLLWRLLVCTRKAKHQSRLDQDSTTNSDKRQRGFSRVFTGLLTWKKPPSKVLVCSSETATADLSVSAASGAACASSFCFCFIFALLLTTAVVQCPLGN